MNISAAMQSYGQVQVNAGVQDASSQKLIAMLFDGLLSRIAQAKGALIQRDVKTKGDRITEAMNIVTGLREFLDVEKGGEIATNLDNLYEYVYRTLLQAHIKNDEEKLNECRDLIYQVSSAWSEMNP